MKGNRKNSIGKAQRGVALIELMIAIVVLAFGLLALVPVIVTAIGTNTNNRLDSNAILLSQSIAEQIAAQPASSTAPLPQLTDCIGAGWTINTAGGAAGVGAGALLFTAGTAPSPQLVGSIDFINQSVGAVPAGYQASWRAGPNVTCNVGNGSLITYDVRWNIQNLGAANPPTIKLITIAARPRFNAGQKMNAQFTLPVSLRMVVGQVP